MERTGSPGAAKAPNGTTIALALSTLLASLGTSIANIALPSLAEAFPAPFRQVQMVVVAYLAALTISVVIAGRLGDRHGLKHTLVAGLAVFALASLACGAAPDLPSLVAARALQGIGAAFLMTLSMALMRRTASEKRMGRAMGLLGTVSALGTALGPSLGGLLIAVTGWRSIFWIQAPLAGIAIVLALVALPGDGGHRSVSPERLWPALSRGLAPNLLVNALVAAVMMATLVVGPFYLKLGLGLQAAQVGFVMAIGPVISIVSGLPSGRLVDARGSGRVLALGLSLLTAGACLLAFLPNLIGVAGYVVSLIVLTPGYQLFQSANNTAALSNIPNNRRGTVSGLLALSRNLGLVAGAWGMGALFSFGVGMDEFAHANASAIPAGMRLTFLMAGAMLIGPLAFAIARPAGR